LSAGGLCPESFSPTAVHKNQKIFYTYNQSIPVVTIPLPETGSLLTG
jgi:hypothetical protein